jgi:hypothetical protein
VPELAAANGKRHRGVAEGHDGHRVPGPDPAEPGTSSWPSATSPRWLA